ncbi:MAG: methyltransferase [bacterium]|nr:methyltransferase [bacterium]
MSNQLFRISIQLWIRLFSLIAFSCLFSKHVLQIPNYFISSQEIIGFILWFLEASILGGYCAAYMLRNPATSTASGFNELIYPFIPAGLPFLFFLNIDLSLPLQLTKIFGPAPITAPQLLWPCIFLIAIGNLISSIALWTLRSNFSIATECRNIVMHGVYKYISHPMYFGQFITFLGVMLIRITPQKLALYVVFVALQWIRLKNEEKKLTQNFKDYDEHIRACWIRF